MWKKSAIWRRKKNRMLWRFSLLFCLTCTVLGADKVPIDRIALIVGNRPVTLSEVRAYYAFHTGRPLPEVFSASDTELLQRMIHIERLFEQVRLYGGGQMQDGWFRLAVHVLNANHGYLFNNGYWLKSCGISEKLLLSIMARELRVLRFIEARTGGRTENVDQLLSDFARDEAAEIAVSNHLF